MRKKSANDRIINLQIVKEDNGMANGLFGDLGGLMKGLSGFMPHAG